MSIQRVIFSDDGTLSDISYKMNDYRKYTSVIDYVAAEDYIFIGSLLPFNHRYFDVSVANSESASVTVSIWDGTTWNAAVDVIDMTASSGASMAVSGIVRFVPNNLKNWVAEDDSDGVTGLSSTDYYDLYWTRLSFSADLTGTFALNYIGHRFCDDDQLVSRYPDLNNSNLFTAWESGKTSWNEQCLAASNEIISDLKNRRLIISPDQILSYEDFELAAIHKTAEIIFYGLGKSYEERRAVASKKYYQEINDLVTPFDHDGDASADAHEKTFNVMNLSR